MKNVSCELQECFLNIPIAHRGLHDLNGKFGKNISENSVSSIRRAIKFGFLIEIDVRMTKDKEIIVFHDRNLKRLTGVDKNIDNISINSLKNLKLPNGEKIPTLRSILDLFSKSVPILIEIKDKDGKLSDTCGTLEKNFVNEIKNFSGRFAIMSSNPHIIRNIMKLQNYIPCGLVTGHFFKKNWPYVTNEYRKKLINLFFVEDLGVSFISNNIKTLNVALKMNRKLIEKKILCWTVRSPSDEAKALKLCSNITFEGFFPLKNSYYDYS